MEKYGKAFKEMTFKEKAEHLWEYYRKPTLFVVIAAVLVINLVIAIVSPREVNSVDIVLAGQIYSDDTQEAVITDLKDKFDAGLTINVVDWTKSGEMEMATTQKIALQLTTKELDILGIPPEAFDSYLRETGSDMFLALDEVPEFKELLKEYKDQLVMSGYEKDDNFNVTKGEQHVYGIKVLEIKNLSCSKLGEDIVLGVTTNTKDIDKTVEMMRYLLEK